MSPDSSLRVLIIHESSRPFSYFLPVPLFFKCISVPEIFFFLSQRNSYHDIFIWTSVCTDCAKNSIWPKLRISGYKNVLRSSSKVENHPDQAHLLISSLPCFSEIGPVTITTDPKKFQYELRELYVQVGSNSSSCREVARP